jgi:hypothetical protein
MVVTISSKSGDFPSYMWVPKISVTSLGIYLDWMAKINRREPTLRVPSFALGTAQVLGVMRPSGRASMDRRLAGISVRSQSLRATIQIAK